MTFSEIRQRILDYCNLSSPDAQVRVGVSINNHYRRLTSTLGMDTTRFVTRTQATTPSVATVTFTAIEKIDRIREVSTGAILTEVSLHDQRSTPTTSNPPATWTTQQAGPDRVVVLLGSASPFVWTLAADGWTTLADLSGVEEPAFPESYHDVLVWWVLAEEFLKKEKLEVAATYAKLAEKVQGELVFQLADSHTRETQQRQSGNGNGLGRGTGGGITPGVPAHAPNHSAGGGDEVNLLNLAGFPGNATQFLRADHVFAVPASPLHHATHEPGGADPMAVDAAAGTGSLRTLGNGANQAAPGNDARFSAPSVPTAHAPTHLFGGTDQVVVTGLAGYPGNTALFLRGDGTFAAPPGGTIPGAHATSHHVGGGDTVSVTALGGFPGGTSMFLRADGTFAVAGGGVPGAHAPTHFSGGSDPLTVTGLAGYPGGTGTFLRADGTFAAPPSGVPSAHATTHKSGGSDPIKLDELGAPTDITTLNATTSAHGLMQKYPGGTTNFLRADGTFAAPPATPVGGANTQVQFNDGGVLGGDAGLTFNKTTDALTVTGALSVGSNLTLLSGDLVLPTAGRIRTGTADGADTGSIQIGGGGDVNATRGSSIYVAGNESGGAIHLSLGNVAGSAFRIYDATAVVAFSVNGSDGRIVHTTSSGSDAWNFNSTAANGAFLTVQRSGAGIAFFGIAEAINPAWGTNDDGVVYVSPVGGKLFLEANGGSIRSNTIWGDAVAGTANMIVEIDGRIRRNSSSLRYKTKVEPLTDWRFLLDLEPVTFARISEPDGRRYGGLIAERVAAVNPVFTVFNADGEPESVAYAELVAPLIGAVKDLNRRLAALET